MAQQQVPTVVETGRGEAPPPMVPAVPRKDVSMRSAALKTRRKVLAGEDRLQLIAEAAYFRAERRGFAPGQELEDWLAAEIEIDALFCDDET